MHLTGVFAPHSRPCTQHVWADHPPVVIRAVMEYFHVHSSQHRGQVGAVNLRHTPATHCAGVRTKGRCTVVRQSSRLDVGIEPRWPAQLQHDGRKKTFLSVMNMRNGTRAPSVISHCPSSADLDEHDVIVEGTVAEVVDKYV